MKTLNLWVEWLEHFFFLIGWSVRCLILLDLDCFYETIAWLQVHLTYKLEKVGKRGKISFKQRLICDSWILVGIIVFFLIMFVFTFFIRKMTLLL